MKVTQRSNIMQITLLHNHNVLIQFQVLIPWRILWEKERNLATQLGCPRCVQISWQLLTQNLLDISTQRFFFYIISTFGLPTAVTRQRLQDFYDVILRCWVSVTTFQTTPSSSSKVSQSNSNKCPSSTNWSLKMKTLNPLKDGKHKSGDIATHPRWPESTAILLPEPQVSQFKACVYQTTSLNKCLHQFLYRKCHVTSGFQLSPNNLTFRGPCIVIYSYDKSQQDALFLNFILVKNATCFR